MGRRQRRIFRGLGLILAGTLVLVLSLPLWFPWVLRPVAALGGIHYSKYERHGYARLVVTNVRLDSRGTKAKAARVETLSPTAWAWRLATASQPAIEPFVAVDHWELSVAPSSGTRTSTDSKIRATIHQIAAINRWLPAAALSNGVVKASGISLQVNSLSWSGDRLDAALEAPPPVGPVTATAALAAEAAFSIHLASPQIHLEARANVASPPSGTEVQVLSSWWSNRVALAAHFTRSGILPATAVLEAPQFRFPAEALHLPDYQAVTGSASASWTQGVFTVDLHATAQPLPTRAASPPLALDLQAHGNTNTVTIETAKISSPFVVAEISPALEIDLQQERLREPVALKVVADLSRQFWLPLEGRLQGSAELVPSFERLPTARFQLSGSNIGRNDLRAQEAELRGKFEWPWVNLTEASAKFTDGSTASLSGRLDLTNQTVSGGEFRFQGPLPKRWLPRGYSYDAVAIAGEFEGTRSNVVHHGILTATNVLTPFFRPLRLQAQWNGTNEALSHFGLELSTAHSMLEAAGSCSAGSNQAEFRLETLTLSTNLQPALALAHPFSLSVIRTNSAGKWWLTSSPVDWAGAGGQVRAEAALAWPSEGSARISVQDVSSRLFAGFLKQQPPQLALLSLEASAAWTNGPLTFTTHATLSSTEPILIQPLPASGNATAAENQPLDLARRAFPMKAELDVSGDPSGLLISNLVVYSRTSNFANASGSLPVTLNPGGTNLIHLDPRAPLRLLANTDPNTPLWDELGKWMGVDLSRPKLHLEIAGSWASPSGAVTFTAQKVQMAKAGPRLPALEDLDMELRLDREMARLTRGRLVVQGQPVSLTGEFPLGAQFWRDLKERKMPDWEKVSGRVQVRHAEVAAFQPLFPQVLGPEGRLDVDLSVLPGLNLSGQMRLEDARTRPLGDFGPVRHINLDMSFHERNLRLERATAELSGAGVTLSGQADLRGNNWLKGESPPFVLTLYGTNVPLVRQPEVVVRSDFELAVTKTNGAPPLITGLARLRDSFFLADLTALIPGTVARPNRRPPYFSIEEPAVADWRLAVNVQGERFMKVRTPIFNGEVSANLKLQGTLKDPIALGDVRINSGSVRFPFGSLEVQQGLVNLTSQDPYHPQLSVSAASKQFGYDIRMDVSGPVDAPVIQFNSTPPLSSEQILLMVTAGQLPQGAFTLTPQQRAQTVALFFGRDLLSKLGVGDQGQQRLTVRSGEEISQQGRPTYHIEYRLSKNWFLVGEYDRFGDYNAGFKWRILSR